MKDQRGKILLVWDIDDVLNRFMLLCCKHFRSSRSVVYEALTENPPYPLLGISREEYLAVLDSCREELYKQPPRPEILRFFEDCGERFDHMVLSAVPMRFAPASAQWVLHCFGQWIQSCIFIPSARPDYRLKSQRFKTKGEVMASLGKSAWLIDDSPHNVEEVRKHGGNALLFPAPWNSAKDIPVDDFLQQLKDLEL